MQQHDGPDHLLGFAVPPQLLGQRPTNLLCKTCPPAPALTNRTSIGVGHGYVALAGLELPRWATHGFLFNCRTAKYAPPSIEEVPLADCLLACLSDAMCDAVTVGWTQLHAWPKPAQLSWHGNKVRCYLRGGVDLRHCEKDAAEAHSTITRVK